MITGINHINLSVKNVEESFQFYQEVLVFLNKNLKKSMNELENH